MFFQVKAKGFSRNVQSSREGLGRRFRRAHSRGDNTTLHLRSLKLIVGMGNFTIVPQQQP